MQFTVGRGNPSDNQVGNMAPPTHHHPAPARRRHIDWAARTVRIELFIILLGCSLLLVAISLFLGINNSPTNSEMDRVATNKYQAVFLNDGSSASSNSTSTYFGHLKAINDKYYVLQNVYYLTNGQSTSNQSSSELTKLGCDQLHSPYDQMIINRDQVAYWENIQDTGKVVQAIKAYNQKFPNGPKCSTATTTTPSSTTPTTTTP